MSLIMSFLWWDSFLLNSLTFLLAVGLDRILPEPPARFHPVVWMGRSIAAMERFAPRRAVIALLFGSLIVLIVVGLWTALAAIAMAGLASVHWLAYVTVGAIILRTTFTVRGLSSAAKRTRHELREGRLESARASLKSLVGRDTRSLSASLVAASAIESVAENSTDSYIGPWLAFVVLGVPGAVAYRAVNTLDSMIGHRGKYEYLGKVAARLDDIVNFVPARLSAMLILISGTAGRLNVGRAWSIMRRDRGRTESPNAGVTMSAMAGLVGTCLEKPGHYRLGENLRPPETEDIGTAIRVAEGAALLGVGVVVGLLAARHAIMG